MLYFSLNGGKSHNVTFSSHFTLLIFFTCSSSIFFSRKIQFLNGRCISHIKATPEFYTRSGHPHYIIPFNCQYHHDISFFLFSSYLILILTRSHQLSFFKKDLNLLLPLYFFCKQTSQPFYHCSL